VKCVKVHNEGVFVVLIMNHWVVYMLVILKLAFLVGSDAAWFGIFIPTFWGNLLLHCLIVTDQFLTMVLHE
jgi:hypothetical protein